MIKDKRVIAIFVMMFFACMAGYLTSGCGDVSNPGGDYKPTTNIYGDTSGLPNPFEVERCYLISDLVANYGSTADPKGQFSWARDTGAWEADRDERGYLQEGSTAILCYQSLDIPPDVSSFAGDVTRHAFSEAIEHEGDWAAFRVAPISTEITQGDTVFAEASTGYVMGIGYISCTQPTKDVCLPGPCTISKAGVIHCYDPNNDGTPDDLCVEQCQDLYEILPLVK